MSEAVEREFRYLAEGVDEGGSLGRYLHWLKTQVLPLFVRKDSEALDFQRKHQFSIKFIYIAAAAVIGIVIAQTLFWPLHVWLIWGEVALIAAMLFVQRWDRKGQFHSMWMQSRFLAEKLRCGFYTFLFKTEEREKDGTPASFLAIQERSAAWESLLESMDFSSRPDIDLEAEREVVVSFIQRSWLAGQKSYHRKTAHLKHHGFEKVERIGYVFLLVTIAAAILHALGVGHYTPWSRPWDLFFHGDPGTTWTVGNSLTLVAILLPAVSASLNAIKNGLEMHKMALRSHRVADGIEPFEKALADCTNMKQVREVVGYIERFFLAEHEEWHSLIAHKEADVG